MEGHTAGRRVLKLAELHKMNKTKDCVPAPLVWYINFRFILNAPPPLLSQDTERIRAVLRTLMSPDMMCLSPASVLSFVDGGGTQ